MWRGVPPISVKLEIFTQISQNRKVKIQLKLKKKKSVWDRLIMYLVEKFECFIFCKKQKEFFQKKLKKKKKKKKIKAKNNK